MSIVKLTTFAVFHRGDERSVPVPVEGISSVSTGANGKHLLVADNVPYPTALTAPKNGLSLLYGFRDTLDEIQLVRARARTSGHHFHLAEIDVEVGEIAPGLVSEEMVDNLKFVNVKRMTADLQEYILTRFASYIKNDGGDPSLEMRRIKEIASRPDLFARLLTEAPFKNLTVVIIPVLDDKRIRQVAYVKTSADIKSIHQNSGYDVEIVLPENFQKN